MDLLRRILHEVMEETRNDAILPRPRAAAPGGLECALEREARALEREARAFLEALNPDSQEGLWFEAVAEGFPTRLDAAVAYIRDVERAQR